MKLVPYIMFSGNAKEALDFYKECLNGEILYVGTYGESPMESPEEHKDKIMHASFSFDGNLVMLSDSMPGKTPPADSNVQLSVDVSSTGEMKEVFDKLSQGGQITMPLQDTFWGATFGMFTDKFGVKWMFNYDKKEEEDII